MIQRIFFQQQLLNAGHLAISFKKSIHFTGFVVPGKEEKRSRLFLTFPLELQYLVCKIPQIPLIKLSSSSCSLSPRPGLSPSWALQPFHAHIHTGDSSQLPVCRLAAPWQYAVQTDCPAPRPPSLWKGQLVTGSWNVFPADKRAAQVCKYLGAAATPSAGG